MQVNYETRGRIGSIQGDFRNEAQALHVTDLVARLTEATRVFENEFFKQMDKQFQALIQEEVVNFRLVFVGEIAQVRWLCSELRVRKRLENNRAYFKLLLGNVMRELGSTEKRRLESHVFEHEIRFNTVAFADFAPDSNHQLLEDK
jgi:hypothetical protein